MNQARKFCSRVSDVGRLFARIGIVAVFPAMALLAGASESKILENLAFANLALPNDSDKSEKRSEVSGIGSYFADTTTPNIKVEDNSSVPNSPDRAVVEKSGTNQEYLSRTRGEHEQAELVTQLAGIMVNDGGGGRVSQGKQFFRNWSVGDDNLQSGSTAPAVKRVEVDSSFAMMGPYRESRDDTGSSGLAVAEKLYVTDSELNGPGKVQARPRRYVSAAQMQKEPDGRQGGDDNQSPTALDDELVASEDIPANYPASALLDNDLDPDGDPISLFGVVSGEGGVVEILGDGTIRFSPTSNFNGEATFSYTVRDDRGAAGSAAVTVNVDPVNDPPNAIADALATEFETVLEFDASQLLVNDIDIDGDSIIVVSVGDPVNGSVDLLPSGLVTFVPNDGFSGLAQFSYTIDDEKGGTAEGLVSVEVSEPNGPPSAVDDNAEIAEDNVLTLLASDLLANDGDPDGDEISIVGVKDPVNGVVSTLADGSISFVPDTDFWGAAAFTYVISDGVDQTEGLVSIDVTPVNDSPVANSDAFSGNQDQQIIFDTGELLANDIDADGDALRIAAVSDPVNCSVEWNGFGEIVFTPDEGFKGQASFNYQIEDGFGGADTGLVTVNIGVGFRILANNASHSILHWDGATGQFLGELVKNPPDALWADSIGLGPDGKIYVGWSGSALGPASVRKHDPVTGEYLGIFSTFEMESDDSLDELTAIIFAPNGQMLVADSIGFDGAPKIFRFQGLNEETPGAFVDEFIGYEEYQRTSSFAVFDMEFDNQGELLVPSAYRHEILIFDPPTIGGGKSRILDIFASAFIYEDRDDGVFKRTGEFADPAESGFNANTTTLPFGIAWGPDGNLYVGAGDSFRSDDGSPIRLGRIMHFSPAGDYLGDFLSTEEFTVFASKSPQDIDFGPDGNLYVTVFRESKILVFGGPNGAHAGQLIRTLTVPDGVRFPYSTSLVIIEDE